MDIRIGLLGASGYTGAEKLPSLISVKDADFLQWMLYSAVYLTEQHRKSSRDFPQH